MKYKYAFGGIGDMLQCIESAINEQTIDIFSHYEHAPDIFTPFGVVINRFEYFNDLDFLVATEPLRRKLYANYRFPTPFIQKTNKLTIGIHIEGSKFSNNFWKTRNLPEKNMTPECFKKILSALSQQYDAEYYVFCSPDRADDVVLNYINEIQSKISIIAYPNIWNSLSCVQNCDIVIGMDSAVKTAASVLQIPSVVFVGNYEDRYRDDNFLHPYVKDGYMRLIKFDNIDSVSTDTLLNEVGYYI